ncbi:MAG: hypothetical protein ABIG39_02090 [Candidatus Micrarchaeota archaeon]
MVLKGQTSTEYLSNYTIASAVVIIILIALSYMGVWSWIFPDQLQICIFQKGLDCESYYIQEGNSMATLKIYNQFEESIVISGVLCSAEDVDPGTALPYGKSWNEAPMPSQRPVVDGITLPQPVPAFFTLPIIAPSEPFDVSVYCYTADGTAGLESLSRDDRFVGLVFIKYRLNSSPALFEHMIHGNLQGRPE